MSRCSSKPGSAVPTIWACFPRHGGAGRSLPRRSLSGRPRKSPQSKLGTPGMMNTVDPVPTYFGTGVDVRRASRLIRATFPG